MNFFLGTEDLAEYRVDTAISVEALRSLSSLPATSLTTWHSGLAAVWDHGAPVAPVQTASRDMQFRLKRVFDIALALAALLALAPLLVFVAVAIKTSSKGPVFFRQQREGLNGTLFEIFKFRSMRSDACDHTGVEQTVAGDTRVTPIGAFIRRTSIDELPQLLNVVRGDMSLVGPRPHVPNMLAAGRTYAEFVPYYHHRLKVLPGLTGWAQANGYRGSTADPEQARARVDHDIAYVQNFSLALDAKIIMRTVAREFITGSAH